MVKRYLMVLRHSGVRVYVQYKSGAFVVHRAVNGRAYEVRHEPTQAGAGFYPDIETAKRAARMLDRECAVRFRKVINGEAFYGMFRLSNLNRQLKTRLEAYYGAKWK